MIRRIVIAVSLVVLASANVRAACVNKFLARTEANRNVVTLLTGKLTFQEAQALSAAIAAHQVPPLEWVDADGKTIAKQFGGLKVIRPMPVGCDGKSSGVIMLTTFPAVQRPSQKMHVRLDRDTTVVFEEQATQ